MAIARLDKMGRGPRSLLTAVMVLIVTAAFLPFREQLRPTEVALTLLLVVLLASTLFGSTAGLLASVMGILSFNFFFLPPYNTFTITGAENWVAFGTFVITALVAGQLSGYARRRAEESETRKREIERLYDELRDAFDKASETEALRRSEKLKSALLDAVTHDLRTPLTSIKASVTTLLDDAASPMLDDESRGEFLEIINEEADRLDQFTQGMVSIAKVEANALDLRRGAASVEEMIENAARRASRQLAGREVSVKIEPDAIAVYSDAASVSEVIYSLLDNAVKYSPAGSPIAIRAGRSGGDIAISVQNQGQPIPAGMRESIFGKFVRGNEEDIHRTGSGLGLGLAIARGIVESQGGTVRVADADEGFATRFVITLPAAPDQQKEKNAETHTGDR